jgi:hypothetical protein
MTFDFREAVSVYRWLGKGTRDRERLPTASVATGLQPAFPPGSPGNLLAHWGPGQTLFNAQHDGNVIILCPLYMYLLFSGSSAILG